MRRLVLSHVSAIRSVSIDRFVRTLSWGTELTFIIIFPINRVYTDVDPFKEQYYYISSEIHSCSQTLMTTIACKYKPFYRIKWRFLL